MDLSRSLLICVVLLGALQNGCTGPVEEPPIQSSTPFDVVEATIGEIQEALLTGRTSCREVVRQYIDRIETYDQATGLNAITAISGTALEQATAIDERLAREEPLGALFCAPILVKDNFDTFDLPTTGGSRAMIGSVAPDDAFLVHRLREADAIVLAKTNMAEWAFSPRQTISSSYGVTANAYALDRVPAGSSGGTASGVAASFGVAGMGSDTGNSVRGPSSHLALFGIRSTLGLTSRDGVVPLVFDRDVAGPMTRTVEDGARLFDVLAGHDPQDELSEPGKREDDYTKRLLANGLLGRRIGVLRYHAPVDDTDPEVLSLFEKALTDLQKAGAEVLDPVEIPNWEEHAAAETFCPTFRYDMANYLKSLGDLAPINDVAEVYEAGIYSDHVKDGLEYFLKYPADVAQEEWTEPCLRFLEHPGRRRFLEDVTAAMDELSIDALVFPTWRYPAASLDKGREEYRGDNSQLVAPSTGMPAATVAMGFVRGELPVGLQFLGRRYSDGLLIQFAYAYEQATQHRRPPSAFPALSPRESGRDSESESEPEH